LEKIDVNSLIKFWEWFQSISDDLMLNPTRPDLIYQIDNRVSDFNQLDWEIGPWGNDKYYFAISPNLDSSKLEFTREFVKYAPKCPGWFFLPSKPEKSDWKGIWKMVNEKGTEILVDSSHWRYILYKFEDETFDMDIVIDDINGDDNTINLAVDIALTGYLGEEKFMTDIQNVKIVTSFEEEHQDKVSMLKHIKSHIESLT